MPLDTSQIASLRLKLGLSVTDAARAAGFKRPGQWSDIERGRQTNLTVGTLERVAKVLQVPAGSLVRPE